MTPSFVKQWDWGWSAVHSMVAWACTSSQTQQHSLCVVWVSVWLCLGLCSSEPEARLKKRQSQHSRQALEKRVDHSPFSLQESHHSFYHVGRLKALWPRPLERACFGCHTVLPLSSCRCRAHNDVIAVVWWDSWSVSEITPYSKKRRNCIMKPRSMMDRTMEIVLHMKWWAERPIQLRISSNQMAYSSPNHFMLPIILMNSGKT